MFTSTNPHISVATEADSLSINRLLNKSYRGEASKKGWTTEAGLIAGNTRADEAMVKNVMQQPDSVFLKFISSGLLTGCVNLQLQSGKLYLGMFGVEPELQGSGIGKQLLQAAEEYAHHIQCKSIYMSVISLRTELIEWYKRYGYTDTGKRIPFEEDGITGRHLKKLEFMIMEKQIAPQ